MGQTHPALKSEPTNILAESTFQRTSSQPTALFSISPPPDDNPLFQHDRGLRSLQLFGRQAAFRMHLCVAFGAERDQVRFLVPARVATELKVVYLQVFHAPAELAAPAIALQHLAVKYAIAARVES